MNTPRADDPRHGPHGAVAGQPRYGEGVGLPRGSQAMTTNAHEGRIHRARQPSILLTLCSAVALSGCADDADIPHVVYPDQLPQPPPDYVYQVPEWAMGDPLLEFTLSEAAQTGWRLAFEGRIRAETSDKRPHTVLVFIESRKVNGNVGFFNSGGASVIDLQRDREVDDTHEMLGAYHVELQGPTEPGIYKVTVVANGGGLSAEPIAMAELPVRKSQ